MSKGGLAILVAVVLFVGATAVVSVSARADGPSATSDSITVVATSDYGYQPKTFEQIATGTTITVTFSDADVLAHSFTISSREGFVIPTNYNPTQLTQLFEEYPAIYSSLLNYSGDRSVGTFESPAQPGWYEFVCNVSGHFQDGMYGFVAFGENLPSNLTTPDRTGVGGGNISPLEAAGIGVGIIAVLAIAYFLWARRSTPPKRPAAAPRSPPKAPPRSPRT
jgi:plastocyanin